MALKTSGKIRHNSKIVFGTADRLRLKIVSANQGFVRAAAGQGCRLSVIAHDGRALSGTARRVGQTQASARSAAQAKAPDPAETAQPQLATDQ